MTLDGLVARFGDYYSRDSLEAFQEALAHPPMSTIARVNALKTNPSTALSSLQCYFAQRDEAFRPRLLEDIPHVIEVASLGPDCVEPASKEVIVDCECGSAVLRGADVFVPGILGMLEGIVAGDKVSVWADLEGKCVKGWRKAFVGSKRFLGNGISRVSRANVFEQQISSGVGIAMVELECKMPGLNGIMEDSIFLQNLPSIMAGLALAPTPSSRVLDMCASPGGKTCHLADLMGNTGLIVAVDKNARKMEKVERNFGRLGVRNGRCIVADSTKLSRLGDPFLDDSFDFILLDPPCSGLGQRPKLCLSLDDFSETALSGYAPYQARLFDQAWRLLKPGGYLAYSTCTINPDENEHLVSKALQRHPDARLVPLRREDGRFLKYAGPGLSVPGISAEQSADCLCRFWPQRDRGPRDTIGFFIAKFQKMQLDAGTE